jgi:hypothetical protein
MGPPQPSFHALDASVGSETNSDLTGARLTAEETELYASIATDEGVYGLAPIEVRRLIEDGQLPYASGVSSLQVLALQKRFATVQRSGAKKAAVLPGARPSDSESKYRDRVSGHIKRHAYRRWPGESHDVRIRRAAYIKEVNAQLLMAFGPRDRLRMDGLVALWEHVRKYYPA